MKKVIISCSKLEAVQFFLNKIIVIKSTLNFHDFSVLSVEGVEQTRNVCIYADYMHIEIPNKNWNQGKIFSVSAIPFDFSLSPEFIACSREDEDFINIINNFVGFQCESSMWKV